MKSVILNFMAILLAANLLSGQALEVYNINQEQESYDFHMEKYRQNKKAAKIFGIGGALSILTGFTFILSQTTDALVESIFEGEGEVSSDLGTALIVVGGISGITSVTLSILANEHKTKATLLLGTNQTNIDNKNTLLIPKNIGVTLIIPLD